MPQNVIISQVSIVLSRSNLRRDRKRVKLHTKEIP